MDNSYRENEGLPFTKQQLAKSIVSPLMQSGEAQALIEKINERA